MYDVIIVGAGFAGLTAAKELADLGYRTLVLEAGKEALPPESSSYNECYKLHLGMHYVGNLETAKQCLIKAIEFARAFPDSLAGGDKLNTPWRRGRHFIMSNSFISKESAIEVAEELRRLYTKLIDEDPLNKIFGEPVDFIKYLNKEDYSYINSAIPFYHHNHEVSREHVVLGIETAESQLDFDKIKAQLQQILTTHSKIIFLPSTKVTGFQQCVSPGFGYTVATQNAKGELETFSARAVVNCAWQKIEPLNKTLNLPSNDENRVIRVKASILIDLPVELRGMNTCLFSAGPYWSITVQPNGTAILTSERHTNVGFYKSEEGMSDSLRNLLKELNLNTSKGQTLASSILVDCASCLSEDKKTLLLDAKIKELNIGYVKHIGESIEYTKESIFEKGSGHHARVNDGVEIMDLGFYSNSGMKMTYTQANAKRVAVQYSHDITIIQRIDELIELTEIKVQMALSLRDSPDSPHISSKDNLSNSGNDNLVRASRDNLNNLHDNSDQAAKENTFSAKSLKKFNNSMTIDALMVKHMAEIKAFASKGNFEREKFTYAELLKTTMIGELVETLKVNYDLRRSRFFKTPNAIENQGLKQPPVETPNMQPH